MHQGDLAGAVEILQRLTADDPANAEAFYNLGVALKQQDQFGPAEDALRRAMSLDAKLADAPFTLGVVVWQTGRAEEAEALFREAIARKPGSADAHYMLGTVLKGLGREADAIAEFQAAIAANPELPEAHLSLSQALQQRGDAQGAARARAEADRLNRRKADAQASTFALSAGRRLLEAGNRDAALAQFREAVRLSPDNADAHLALAESLKASGASVEARKHLEEARRLKTAARSPQSAQ
jgi:tetratricopeptide (TPR) repeat protein